MNSLFPKRAGTASLEESQCQGLTAAIKNCIYTLTVPDKENEVASAKKLALGPAALGRNRISN